MRAYRDRKRLSRSKPRSAQNASTRDPWPWLGCCDRASCRPEYGGCSGADDRSLRVRRNRCVFDRTTCSPARATRPPCRELLDAEPSLLGILDRIEAELILADDARATSAADLVRLALYSLEAWGTEATAASERSTVRRCQAMTARSRPASTIGESPGVRSSPSRKQYRCSSACSASSCAPRRLSPRVRGRREGRMGNRHGVVACSAAYNPRRAARLSRAR